MPPGDTSPCAICQGRTATPISRINDYTILRCDNCSVCFSDALYRVDLAGLYTKSYFSGQQVSTGYADYHRLSSALERNAVRRLRRLEGLLGQDRALLDVGCGTGEFLRVAAERGWQCAGVEISPYAAEYGRARYGLDISEGALTANLFPTHAFSAITLWDVVEHLPDPLTTLAICAQLLKPKGVLAISTGDIGSLCARVCGRYWHLFNLPEHVFFFSRRTIRDLVKRAGFEVLSIAYPSSVYPLGYLLERLYKSAFRRVRSTPDFRCAWLVRCNLFDIMEVLGTPLHH